MKKILILIAAATFVCLMSTSGFALLITDTGVAGIIDSGTASANEDTVTAWANYLLSLTPPLTPTTFDADGDGSDEYYEAANEYEGTLTGGLRINSSTPNVSGFDWVLAKYDGQNAGYVLFYMPDYGTSIPEFSYSIWGDNPAQYQLSNVTVFGGTSVPEPATMFLLGTGLLGLAGLRRKFKK